MNKKLLKILPAVDALMVPFVFFSAWALKLVRRIGVHRMPASKNILMRVGVFPIRNHYYEPQFDFRTVDTAFSENRNLPGIDWNIDGQLSLLKTLVFAEELVGLPENKTSGLEYYLENNSFKSGDAEFWYQLIRSTRPKRIFEIGSGNSTLIAIKALKKNQEEDTNYYCHHVCIEPYEMQWLEDTGVDILRKKVEDIDISYFSALEENDILFIDSSHIIRPQGDVLFEYLELLPTLNNGVIVHVHDIFSPKNYLSQWIENEVKFWNEQYLVEAFLTHNNDWKIIGALNFLHHSYYENLKAVAPYLDSSREPGSLYIKKTLGLDQRHSPQSDGRHPKNVADKTFETGHG